MKFNLDIDTSRIVAKVTEVCNDGYVLRDIHRLLAKMCEDYVPFDTGKLNRATYYDKNGVHYGFRMPYAHYMYEGIVYGPNVPYIVETTNKKTGEVTRKLKWSSPVSPKHPTGNIVYNQDWVLDDNGKATPVSRSSPVHPKATAHWDQVMLQEKGEEFSKRAGEIVKRRLRKLNG